VNKLSVTYVVFYTSLLTDFFELTHTPEVNIQNVTHVQPTCFPPYTTWSKVKPMFICMNTC